MLWQSLTRHVWRRTHRIQATWRQEYIYRHRVAVNFQQRNCIHAPLHFDPTDVESPDGLICRCLTLSEHHLAAGFADGAVRLFDLPSRIHIATFRPDPNRDRLGHYSRSVAGIIVYQNTSRIVFATYDGDIHVIDNVLNPAAAVVRRAHVGVIVNDGVLLDFAGCSRYWVGLYAGIPGRSMRIWNAMTETITLDGGSLTDHSSMDGWRMLTELNDLVGRVRVSEEPGIAVACTRDHSLVFDLRNQVTLSEEENVTVGFVVGSAAVNIEAYVMMDTRGRAIVRRLDNLQEICRFDARVRGSGAMACMNLNYVLVCAGGVIRIWRGEFGNHLYRFRERLNDDVNAFVADDRYVVAAAGPIIHFWDFGIVEEEEGEEGHGGQD